MTVATYADMVGKRRILGLATFALLAFATPGEPARVAHFAGDTLSLLDGGALKRSDLTPLLRGRPDWTVTADVAALGRAERRDWQLTRAECLPPVYRRCLFFLAEEGRQGVALREYDTEARQFVADGFALPPGPTQAAWYDDNRILVTADTGPGTLTAAGSPRLVKLWTRGMPVSSASTILAAPFDTAELRPVFSLSGGGLFHAAEVTLPGGARELYHFGWAQNFRRSALPPRARLLDFFQGRAVALLGESWHHGGQRFVAGSIVAYPMAPLLGPASRTLAELAYSPPAGFGVIDARAGRDTLYVHLRGAAGDRLVAIRKGAPDWPSRDIVVPGDGPMSLIAASDLADVALVARDGSLFFAGRGRARAISP